MNVTKLEVGKIHNTKNYDDLRSSTPIGNRAIGKGQVNKLIKAIRRRGQLTPVLLNKRGVLLDGQHRIAACEALDVPVKYMVIAECNATKAKALETIAEMNSSQKNWSLLDHLHAGAKLGVAGHKDVLNIIEQRKVASLNVLMGLKCGFTDTQIREHRPLTLIALEKINQRLTVFSWIVDAYQEMFSTTKSPANLQNAVGNVFECRECHLALKDWERIALNLSKVPYIPGTRVLRPLDSIRAFKEFFNDARNYRVKKSAEDHTILLASDRR